MEQLVARRAHNPKVIGSSPVPATKKKSAVTKVTALFLFTLTLKLFLALVFALFFQSENQNESEEEREAVWLFLVKPPLGSFRLRSRSGYSGPRY